MRGLLSTLNKKYSQNIELKYLEARNENIKESSCYNKRLSNF